MGFLRKANRKEKQQQEAEKRRIEAYLKDLGELNKRHEIGFRPVMTRLGMDIEFFCVKKKSEIITPESGIILPK